MLSDKLDNNLNYSLPDTKISEDKKWYVVLTRTHAEYKVREYLSLLNIENFLPIQSKIIEKKGKTAEKEHLVLPRMVFVHISREEMQTVRNTMNVFDFLRDRSRSAPTSVPPKQMADFRYMLDYSRKEVIVTGERIPAGTPVVVAKGDLKGLQGELVRYEGKYHILVRIDIFGCALVSIPASFVKKEKEN
ncbi:UpxY family transcription antiterminator [uncultured Bacteroides sp.]|uniref:UpxY family transcription antiterminator n=1 Tax=uncultured Bacteroides sp. TaxID=162156 RepID=UPI002AA6349B|nr:UpxY family transcription antiterminator [uncultured Bacteroides sp.]